jgi:non-ribosomal peptide synthetase component F
MFELTFDVSVVSTLYPLTLGACIYTVGFEDVKYLKVFDILERYELTFATVAPSLLQLIAPYFDEISLPNLKYLAVTAEASSVDTLERFRHCAPNAQFVNLYGPTEGTIYCTVYHIPSTGQIKQYNGMTAIGRPLKNVDIRLVDEKGNCVPIGEQGELWICGPQVMSGYWKDERKTATALFRDPSGKIFYKTNDICIMDKDGDLLYCGRKDNQIKIQGFRVELSEIEYDAHQFFNENHNAAAVALDREGCKEIHLAVDCTQEELEGLSNYLKEKLPSYMIPKQIHCLDSFPLNTNNKIDRKAIVEIIKQQ